ncbi:Snf7-domain-containing protein [Massariosphaeria phaeospora]|uniref:Snf7-domain-containing protein n=1 Tax=Massariosphaeria phaeospora TaxID=100035 RepID=A0A7C8M1X7_9PLEO|nr:Snf7-domain-containing protein [Massariosphaeria phaeospora]
MLKRKLSREAGLGDDPRGHYYDYSTPRMTKRLFREHHNKGWTPPTQSAMPELVEWILVHEDAFHGQSRVTSLFSDFRQQLNTNPDGYHANIAAWKKALADATRAGLVPAPARAHLLSIQTGDELARELQHPKFGIPACLPTVFSDAVARKEMIPLKDFLNSPTSIYKKSWIPSPWSVLRWGLRQVGVLGQPGSSDKLDLGNLVVLGNVEAAAKEILKSIDDTVSSADRVLSRSAFLKRYATVLNPAARLTANDLNILLVHLARDRQAISYDAQTIKFKAETEIEPVPITKEDTAIANLRDTIVRISAQIAPLNEKIVEANKAAREAVELKQMVRAKTALRSKKLAETALAQRSDVVLQLEGVYHDLQQAADQVEIVAAMKAGATALKGLNHQVGGAEGVQGVVDALRDEMATADEVANIINETGQPVDEAEIDEEFEALEKAETEKREQEEAAKTAARLAELEKLESERKEKEAAQKKEREESEATAKALTDKQILEASFGMANMSFVQESESEDDEDMEEEEAEGTEHEKQPVPA